MADQSLLPTRDTELRRRKFRAWAVAAEQAINPNAASFSRLLPTAEIEIWLLDGTTRRGGAA